MLTYKNKHIDRLLIYLDVSPTNHDTVHLLQSELCGLGNLVFNEGKALVFVCDWVPREVDTLYGTKGNKCLFYCVLFNLKVNTAYINPVMKNSSDIRLLWSLIRTLNFFFISPYCPMPSPKSNERQFFIRISNKEFLYFTHYLDKNSPTCTSRPKPVVSVQLSENSAFAAKKTQDFTIIGKKLIT